MQPRPPLWLPFSPYLVPPLWALPIAMMMMMRITGTTSWYVYGARRNM
jgi:hypothetical protein